MTSANSSSNGGGIKGVSVPHILNSVNNNEFQQTRVILREAWNTSFINKTPRQQRAIGPFRAVNNAGDLLSRQNYSCGGSTQSFQSRPNMFGLGRRFGAIISNCDNTGVPASACNTKFVYDSSDYTTYLKQRSINRNYNDKSQGGDDHFSSQSVLKAIRRR